MRGAEHAPKHALEAPTLRVRTFSLLPEFKIPKKTGANTAVADQWIWNEGGEETMLPLWDVRRMTALQLARAKADVKPGRLSPRFNCEIVMHHLTTCVITSIKLQTYTRARIFEVPFLTNSEELEAGEELILEIAEKV